MAKKNLISATLNISASAESMKALEAFMDTMGIQYEAARIEETTAPKEAASDKKTTSKAAKGSKVKRVDKYGRQWIGKYDQAAYDTYCEEHGKPASRKGREEAYRALGWVL